MKNLKRFLILILSLVFINTLFVNAVVDTDYTLVNNDTAGYKIVERKVENNLNYGVVQYTDISETIRGGAVYKQQVNVMEVPSTSNAKIISYANLTNHRWTLTTVKELAIQFEKENPGWYVIGAINADFFDIGAKGNLPYQTSNAVVTNGEYYKTSTGQTVGFTNDGTTNTLLGGVKPARSQYMKLAIYDENDLVVKEFDIQKLNTAPGVNETSIYFGTYDATHAYVGVNVETSDATGFFIDNAELALPNNANDFYGKGVISSISTSKSLNRGQFAIVTNNAEVKEALAIGKKIRTQFEFTGEFAKATSVTGYSGKFLTNGEFNPNHNAGVLDARHPRTAVGVKPDGTIVMTVIDGRQAVKGMEGVFGDEMAAVLKRYGCVEAYNLDGGGSSTLMIREEGEFVIMNSPSDGNERKDSNALLVAIEMPKIDIDVVQSQNYLTFNLNMLDNNNFDIQQLYVEMNGEIKPLEDSKATFENLNPNTEYFYRIKYLNSENKINDLLIDGLIKSLKIEPQIIDLEISEVGAFFEIKLIYSDPDYTSNLKLSELRINDKLKLLTNGETVVMKSQVGEAINSLSLTYKVDLNDDDKIIVINVLNYTIKTSVEQEIFNALLNSQNELIDEIYR